MIHLHLLWIVPLATLCTMGSVGWFYSVDPEGLIARGVYQAVGIILGWWIRGMAQEAVRRLALIQRVEKRGFMLVRRND